MVFSPTSLAGPVCFSPRHVVFPPASPSRESDVPSSLTLTHPRLSLTAPAQSSPRPRPLRIEPTEPNSASNSIIIPPPAQTPSRLSVRASNAATESLTRGRRSSAATAAISRHEPYHRPPRLSSLSYTPGRARDLCVCFVCFLSETKRLRVFVRLAFRCLISSFLCNSERTCDSSPTLIRRPTLAFFPRFTNTPVFSSPEWHRRD